MFDRFLMLLEIALLIWIVYQGEIIVRCEKGVYQLQRERESERAKWREQKRQQQLKKENNTPERKVGSGEKVTPGICEPRGENIISQIEKKD